MEVESQEIATKKPMDIDSVALLHWSSYLTSFNYFVTCIIFKMTVTSLYLCQIHVDISTSPSLSVIPNGRISMKLDVFVVPMVLTTLHTNFDHIHHIVSDL